MTGFLRGLMSGVDPDQYGASAVATIGIQQHTYGCLYHALQVWHTHTHTHTHTVNKSVNCLLFTPFFLPPGFNYGDHYTKMASQELDI